MGVKYVFVFCLYIYEIHKWHYGLDNPLRGKWLMSLGSSETSSYSSWLWIIINQLVDRF